MMTRKDYVKIAKILSWYQYDENCEAHYHIVGDFAIMLAKDNPRFDEEKFKHACGVLT